MSREGGFRQRSVFGGAARVKDPIHSGTADGGMLSAVKDELSGGMASRSLFLSLSLSVPLSLFLSRFAGGSERGGEMRRGETR